MSASKKLITAIKALSYISTENASPKQSKAVSEFIQCNASKLRSILALLVKSDILESIQGSNGGFKLKRNPVDINLQEVYCAIEDRKAFHMDFSREDMSNLAHYEEYFDHLFQQIQIEIEDKMKTITLKDIIEQTQRNDYGFLKKITY